MSAPLQSALRNDDPHSLLNLFLAAALPFLLVRLLRFFSVDWPNFVYRRLVQLVKPQVTFLSHESHAVAVTTDAVAIRYLLEYLDLLQRRRRSATDAGGRAVAEVPCADYEFTFLYEDADDFSVDWLPLASPPGVTTPFGRTVAGCMQVKLVPPRERSIRVEDGLFVRCAEGCAVKAEGPTAPGSNTSSSDEEGSDDGDGRGTNQTRKAREKKQGDAGGGMFQFSMDLNTYMFHTLHRHRRRARRAMKGRYLKDDDTDSRNPNDGRGPFCPSSSTSSGNSSSSTMICDEPEEQLHNRKLIFEYRRTIWSAISEWSSLLFGGAPVGKHEAKDRVQRFLDSAYEWHLQRSQQGVAAPLYVIYPELLMTSASPAGGADDRKRRCKSKEIYIHRYVLSPALKDDLSHDQQQRLSEEEASRPASVLQGRSMVDGKTFDSLHFPQKEAVVQLLHDFRHHSGAYGVAGVSQKLTFLLHGPPGSGKTSFIKALARHLRRHIVSIPLESVLTTTELQTLMNVQTAKILRRPEGGRRQRGGCATTMELNPQEVIFVFEDFDAVGQGWSSLCSYRGKEEAPQPALLPPHTASSAAPSGANGSTSTATPTDSDTDGDGDSDDNSSEDPLDFLLKTAASCPLTVESFIDVFNSFTLPEESVAVFTTNKYASLHPELLSSCMMDSTINMGTLTPECGLEMVEQLYSGEVSEPGEVAADGKRPALTPAQRDAVLTAIQVYHAKRGGLSGAQLEKLCLLCEDCNSLIDHLSSDHMVDVQDIF